MVANAKLSYDYPPPLVVRTLFERSCGFPDGYQQTNRQTDQQTNRLSDLQTNKPTDQQTDGLLIIGKLQL